MLAQLGGSPSAVRCHEELFAYWASLRQGGFLPGRAHLDPGAIKRHLPTVSLTERDAGGRYRLRLAGTGLYGVYGREITGKALDDVYAPEAAAYWRTELDRVADQGRPGVGCHSLSWRGQSHLSLLWIRLPLASDGQRVDMILGYDAILGSAVDSRNSGIRAA
jgi:hypothetical protein